MEGEERRDGNKKRGIEEEKNFATAAVEEENEEPHFRGPPLLQIFYTTLIYKNGG